MRGRRIELNTDDFPILEYRLAQRASRPNFVIDPIAEQPQRYNVDIARMAPDPAEWLDRAVVLYHVHNYAYDRFFRRELEADPSLLKMFNARVAGST